MSLSFNELWRGSLNEEYSTFPGGDVALQVNQCLFRGVARFVELWPSTPPPGRPGAGCSAARSLERRPRYAVPARMPDLAPG